MFRLRPPVAAMLRPLGDATAAAVAGRTPMTAGAVSLACASARCLVMDRRPATHVFTGAALPQRKPLPRLGEAFTWPATIHDVGVPLRPLTAAVTATPSRYSSVSAGVPSAFLRGCRVPYAQTVPRAVVGGAAPHALACAMAGFMTRPTPVLRAVGGGGGGAPRNDQLQGVREVDRYRGDDDEEGGGGERKAEEGEDPFAGNGGEGYLPFPAPFHTFNVVMFLFLANVIMYMLMNFSGSDTLRSFIVEHFTLSHDNWTRIYPLFTNALYQENLLQMLIDCWLLWQFGKTMLGFLGNARMTFFAVLCILGGDFIHIARQYFLLHYCEMEELEVRGRCYGPNPLILGLISVEGLIFRHLNFIQQPPVPFLLLTAFVMVIDVWRIFTTKPEEHGASTGGALVAYLFWIIPTRYLGLDKLTATL